MNQLDIDVFVESAKNEELSLQGLMDAVTHGIPVSGRHSGNGSTALHQAALCERRDLVVALLAAGADANVKDNDGDTPVLQSAWCSSADILQLLIDGGGSVNEPDHGGHTPLIALVLFDNIVNEADSSLDVLLACHDLDLDTRYAGKTAEELAVYIGRTELATKIVNERGRRVMGSSRAL